MKNLINRVCLFTRIIVGATRSNHAHASEGGRVKQNWLASIPFGSLTALWAVSNDYGQMDAQVGVMDWHHNEETDVTVDIWVQTHVEDCGLTVYMCTPEWRAQGEGEGVVQFNPHKWGQNGYFLCFLSKGKVLPLPWLWGVVIPHPSTLLVEKAVVEAERKSQYAQQMEERRLFDAGLTKPRRSSRSSR